MARNPVSIKAVRKKKQQTIVPAGGKQNKPIKIPTSVRYILPEGDDWKPLGWDGAWDIVFARLYPLVCDRIIAEDKLKRTA